MSKIAAVGGNLLKKAVALRVGKALLTKPVAMAGLGIGAAAGVGYLAYSYLEKRKKDKRLQQARNEYLISDDLEDYHNAINAEYKIII